MIARRRLFHPGWHLTTDWVPRIPRMTFAHLKRRDERFDAERAAMQAARERRQSDLRVDAERHYSGLTPR